MLTSALWLASRGLIRSSCDGKC